MLCICIGIRVAEPGLKILPPMPADIIHFLALCTEDFVKFLAQPTHEQRWRSLAKRPYTGATSAGMSSYKRKITSPKRKRDRKLLFRVNGKTPRLQSRLEDGKYGSSVRGCVKMQGKSRLRRAVYWPKLSLNTPKRPWNCEADHFFSGFQ